MDQDKKKVGVPQPGDHAITAKDARSFVSEPSYAGVLSFFRRKYTKDLTDAEVVVSGVPLDTATTGRPGARFGPAGIRAASAMIAWGPPYPWGFNPMEKLNIIDYGDCYWDMGRQQEMPAAIEAHARKILASGASMLTLGGDHFISYPLLKAHAEKHGPLSLVHFDAHSDTWRDDSGRVDHGTMFFRAAEDGIVDPARSVQIGLRTHNSETHGFNILDAQWIHDNGVKATVAEIKRIVGKHKAYLTFDIDCLDPANAPGTGTPVAGGLSSAQALGMFRGMTGMNFVGMDVVEVAPPYDHAQITALAAATLAIEYLALLVLQKEAAAAPG